MRGRVEALAAALVLLPWVALGTRDMTHVARVMLAHESAAGIASIVGALATYYEEPRLDGRHRCPTGRSGVEGGVAGPTPPLAVACHRGPGGRCRPREAPTGPGEYASAHWHDDPLWRDLDLELTEPHLFHYALRTRDMAGECAFVVSAYADLDGDGEHSRIEVRGRQSASGILLDPTWRIDQPTE